MDALIEKKYTIYFGGSYRESWNADFMSVIYSDRRWVYSKFENGIWKAVGGDGELCQTLNSPDCPGMMRCYFEAASIAISEISDFVRRGIGVHALPEKFRNSDNSLVAPELMRVLMDECGYSINGAYGIAIRCCGDCRAVGIDASAVAEYQPRTANIINMLRKTASNILSIEHIAINPEYREPVGPVCCGEDIRLSVKVLSGKVNNIFLVLRDENDQLDIPMVQEGSVWTVKFKAPDYGAALWYCFMVAAEDKSQWLCVDNTGFCGKLYSQEKESFRLTVHLKDFTTPKWFKKATMYQIFPDRFAFSDDDTAKKGVEYHRSLGQTAELHGSLDEPVRYQARPFESCYLPDDFYGGTFRGIENKLPYLKELGISCIYLNPIVEARSNHRYDASDYMRPDPVLGTVRDFEQLCKAAKKMGMRIILDGVYSHTGADSVYFNRYGHYPSLGACQSKKSPYYKWFDFKHYPDNYKSWWGFTELPEVNECDADYDKYIISGEDSVTKTWLRRGASGWRLDVADEIPDEVLSRIRDAAKSVDPDAPIIGEVWDDAVTKISYGKLRNYALGYSLDSVMNYPLRTAILDFLHWRSDAYQFRNFLISQQMNYPKPMYYSLMNLLGTHDVERLVTNLSTDVNIRSLSREEQLRLGFTEEDYAMALKFEALAAAILYSLPGVPSLYYGDEQGMHGVCDPFNRMPFRETGCTLHKTYSELINLRRANDALSTGDFKVFAPSNDVLMVLRYITGGVDVFGEKAENSVWLCVINRASEGFVYEADCSYAGLGVETGVVGPMSYKFSRLK